MHGILNRVSVCSHLQGPHGVESGHSPSKCLFSFSLLRLSHVRHISQHWVLEEPKTAGKVLVKGGMKEVDTTGTKIEPQPGTEISEEGTSCWAACPVAGPLLLGRTYNLIFIFDCNV